MRPDSSASCQLSSSPHEKVHLTSIMPSSPCTSLSGKFLENWLNRPNLQGIPAIEWGLGHEKQAILCYEELLHVRVQPTGLWLSPDGALGASPDGLVYGGEGIIEVKCPFSCRAAENWQDAVETGLIPPYLQFEDEEGEQVTLKKTSNYYHQVQGQLNMTGAMWCDFVVWTPGYMKISRIYPDRAWVKTVLPVLCDFARNCLPLCALDPVTGAVEGVSQVHFFYIRAYFYFACNGKLAWNDGLQAASELP